MCGLCGILGGAEHWTDAGGGAASRTARQQLRARLVNRVLAPYGLRLDGWAGGYLLRGRTGQTAMVPHLGALWPAAERLAGRVCDPLDPELIRRLDGAPPGGT